MNEQVIFKNIDVSTQMIAIKDSENRCHEFEGKWSDLGG